LDVLIAVEDPGAANFVLELPSALEDAGAASRIFACGHAWEYLQDRRVECRKYPVGLQARDFLEKHDFRLLLAGTSQNPDSPVLALIDEFKRQRLPVVAFVDMAADADLRFKGRSNHPLQHEPQSLIVVDRTTELAFVNLGFPAERIHVCGHPAYDRVRRRAAELAKCDLSGLRTKVLGIDPSPRPVWMFAAEHGDDDPRQRRSADYTLHGRGTSDRRADIVLEEILDVRASLDPRPFVVLRLHPKNSRVEFARYLSEVDMVSQGGDAIELIWVSDLVLGMSSILLMEAAVAGRPTLSVVPRESERAWSPSVTEELTPAVTTRDALKKMLDAKNVAKCKQCEGDSVSRVTAVVLSQLHDHAVCGGGLSGPRCADGNENER